MYAIAMNNLGNYGMVVPMGNQGTQRLHNKTKNGWLKETEIMRKCSDEVYVIKDFTQEMCEMNNGKLIDHIIKNCVCRLK